MSAPTLTRPAPAGPRRATPARRRPDRWAALPTALAAGSTCGAVLALDPVLAPGPWAVTTTAAVLACAVVVAFLRTVLRGAARPTLIGAALSGAAVIGFALSGVDGASGLGAVVDAGLAEIRVGVVPMPPGPAVTTFVVTGALAVFLLLDLSAALRAPVLGGLAPATLWMPAVTLGFPSSAWTLVWAGLPWLLLVADTGSAPRGERLRRAAWSVGLLVAAIALTPAAAALPGWGTGALPALGSGGPVALSDNLDLRRDLVGQSGQVVLRYSVSGTDSVGNRVNAATLGPLRSFTLRSFDGRTWHTDSQSPDLVPVTPGRVLEFGSLPSRTIFPGAGTVEVDVQVLSLADRYLPLTTTPRALDVAGQWSYDPLRDQVVGKSRTSSGTTYTMLAEPHPVSGAELARAGTVGLPSASEYLAVPDTPHSRDVKAMAEQVVGQAGTAYDQAVALQRFFRTGGQFTYDERVPPASSSDAVWDFLRDRRGYCVQFATAMTIMARSLGIPARIGVGFLPGRVDEQGNVTVTGHYAHAWPELWFNGVGWVRFEPTPAVQSGAPPPWTVPAVDTSNQPQIDYLGAAGAANRPAPSISATAGTVTRTAPRSGGVQRYLVPGGAGLALAGLAIAVVVLRRSRARAALDPERAWEAARAALTSAGLGWSDAVTPRVAAGQVRDDLRPVDDLGGIGPRQSASDAFDSLAREVERARYAPPGAVATSDELRAWLEQLRSALASIPRSDQRARS